ncbi:MAG: hypothetical protein JOZ63_00555 [Planctomycetaceae bacterium]|nr:hypothetical protein [Planctomycetaceae bacterium]
MPGIARGASPRPQALYQKGRDSPGEPDRLPPAARAPAGSAPAGGRSRAGADGTARAAPGRTVAGRPAACRPRGAPAAAVAAGDATRPGRPWDHTKLFIHINNNI